MIYIKTGDLWLLLGIWMAVTACVFMLGWHASGHSARWAPPPLPEPPPPPLPRRGALRVVEEPATAIDIQRWWPGMERSARPATVPLSHVEVSNWEKHIRRDTDAWHHDRGLPYDQD